MKITTLGAGRCDFDMLGIDIGSKDIVSCGWLIDCTQLRASWVHVIMHFVGRQQTQAVSAPWLAEACSTLQACYRMLQLAVGSR